ncbi:MAG: hypothetical protein QM504_08120 [Pseudomonadota bacterium]
MCYLKEIKRNIEHEVNKRASKIADKKIKDNEYYKDKYQDLVENLRGELKANKKYAEAYKKEDLSIHSVNQEGYLRAFIDMNDYVDAMEKEFFPDDYA